MATTEVVVQTAEERIEVALRAWGAAMRAGRSGCGYPSVNVLHRSWSPPAQGMRPGMKVTPSMAADVARLGARIAELCLRLRNTLVVVYVHGLPAVEQAARLGCAESTVRARVREAKLLLM